MMQLILSIALFNQILLALAPLLNLASYEERQNIYKKFAFKHELEIDQLIVFANGFENDLKDLNLTISNFTPNKKGLFNQKETIKLIDDLTLFVNNYWELITLKQRNNFKYSLNWLTMSNQSPAHSLSFKLFVIRVFFSVVKSGQGQKWQSKFNQFLGVLHDKIENDYINLPAIELVE